MITMIISTELSPVMLIPKSRFKVRILSVTRAIDRPKARTTLSKALICLKKTSVQAKPGRKNTNVKPRIALMAGTDSRKGRPKSNNCLMGDNQSIYILTRFKKWI